MRKIIRPFLNVFLCICLLLQTGCWDRKQYEEIGFILQSGLELGPDGNQVYSVTYPVIAPDTEGKVEFLSTSSKKLIRTSRESIRNVSGKLLQSGKVQHLFYSKELAHRGIDEFLEILFRDPENPLLANIIVIDGSPKEMMETSLDFKNKPRPAFYLNELLNDARRRFVVPELRAYKFRILNYSGTIDPAAPLIRYSKDDFEIAGTALFSGEKMAGEIDTEQTKLLNALMNKKGKFEYTYSGPVSDNGDKIKSGASMMIKPKSKIKINIVKGVPVIAIDLDLKAFLDEYSGEDYFDDDSTKKKLEYTIAETIKKDTEKLLNYMKDIGSDPVGFREILRSGDNKYWKTIKWKEVYKTVEFKVNVDLIIQSYGAIR